MFQILKLIRVEQDLRNNTQGIIDIRMVGGFDADTTNGIVNDEAGVTAQGGCGNVTSNFSLRPIVEDVAGAGGVDAVGNWLARAGELYRPDLRGEGADVGPVVAA